VYLKSDLIREGGSWWEGCDKRGGLSWERPDERDGLWWEGPYNKGTAVQMYQKIIVPRGNITIGI